MSTPKIKKMKHAFIGMTPHRGVGSSNQPEGLRSHVGCSQLETFTDLYSVQPRFLFCKIRFGQLSAAFWLHVSV